MAWALISCLQKRTSSLRERGIIVRYFDKPRISDYLRITIGTDAECDALVQALTEILA
jgi:histidinol-phosphate aminotransferase